MPADTIRIRFTHQRHTAVRRASTLGGVAAVAATAFALVARAVATRRTREVDHRLTHAATPTPTHPTRRVARALGPLGKWYTYLPAAVATATWLHTRGPRGGRARRELDAAGHAIVLAALTSFTLTRLFDHVLPQPPAPPGHGDPNKPVFPSGHAFGTLAVGLTMAYTLARTSLVAPGRAFLAALAVPVVSAGGRFLEERHWPTDILGGALGGVAVAGTATAIFEIRR